MSVSRWFKFWPLGCLLFVTGCIYFWNLDTAFCSISNAEVDVVNGYYYARGGRYIQRGNPHSRNALLDIFSLFDDSSILQVDFVVADRAHEAGLYEVFLRCVLQLLLQQTKEIAQEFLRVTLVVMVDLLAVRVLVNCTKVLGVEYIPLALSKEPKH